MRGQQGKTNNSKIADSKMGKTIFEITVTETPVITMRHAALIKADSEGKDGQHSTITEEHEGNTKDNKIGHTDKTKGRDAAITIINKTNIHGVHKKVITSQGNCTKAITRTPDIMYTREKTRMEIQDGHKAKKKKEIIDNSSISTGTITDNGVKMQETDGTTTPKGDNLPRIKDKEKLKEGRDTQQDRQMR